MYDYKWLLLIGIVALIISYWMRQSKEGFSSLNDYMKIQTCHGVTKSIRANKSLLEEYIGRNAVDSIELTQSAIEHFSNASNQLDCESLIKSHPIPDITIPERDDVMKASIIKIQEMMKANTK